jgi:hypothetical protein
MNHKETPVSRKRIYANVAERQKAYRQRAVAPEPARATNTCNVRTVSRPKRLAAALVTITNLQQEYEQWRDRLPEFQEGSEQETKLTETIELLEQALELLMDIQLPKGFGRD